jgi:proteasome accessory factor C
MSKAQSTPIAKAARLLDLVPYISTHQGISLKTLAGEFDVTPAELLDDLNTLWMCGLPGYTPLELIDLSFESGYVSIRNAEVLQKVRLLTKEELVVIAIGLDLLRDSIPSEREDLQSAINSLAKKIKGLIGEVAAVTPNVDSAHRAVILRAMKERRDVEIRYHSLIRDEISDRVITPIEFGEDGGQETLFAYCSKAKAFRTFRLDNFRSAAISDQKSSFSKVEEVEGAIHTVECEIDHRLRTTLERFRLETAAISPKKGEIYKVQSFSQDWLLRNFLSTLGNAKLLGSTDLAEMVADKARATLDLYRSDTFA